MSILDWLLSLFGKKPQSLPGWSILYSPGMPARMSPTADGMFFFDFPQSDGVHYVTKAAPPAILGQTITMKFSIIGNGTLFPTQGEPPARVRLMLQQRNDNLRMADARWWSKSCVDLLGPGDYVLTAKIDPDFWTTIGGDLPTFGASGFLSCLMQLGNVGFTFGGMFAGHGVFAQGPSRFVLKQFSIL